MTITRKKKEIKKKQKQSNKKQSNKKQSNKKQSNHITVHKNKENKNKEHKNKEHKPKVNKNKQSKKTSKNPGHTEQHTYTKYYPSIIDPNFSHKIATHKIFKKYKLTRNEQRLNQLYKSFEENKQLLDDNSKKKQDVYILKPTQKLLRNFMSPYTPYRGLLIYHEMGVGKSCTAITIAESLKSIITNSNNTKIYVIRPDEIIRQVFDINVVKNGNPLYQCTGDTYIQSETNIKLSEECSNGNNNSCDSLIKNVDKEIKQYYEFIGSRSWANNVKKELIMKTKGIQNPIEKEEKERKIISKMFNNSVIIVDEAHELRDNNDDKDSKTVPPILNKVLEYSTNLRLIFLTATPIYDKPQNIISIINYLLKNDNRKIMKESDIFDNNSNLKDKGRHILENNTRGYISYLRGNNPYDFPIRLSAKYNIPDKIFNNKKYPIKNYNNTKIDKDDTIKYLELVDCPLQSSQLEIINYHIKTSKIPDINENLIDSFSNDVSEGVDDEEGEGKREGNGNEDDSYVKNEGDNEYDVDDGDDDDYIQRQRGVAYQFERQLSNITYQTLDECNKNLKLATGTVGLNQITKLQKGNWTYEFNDPEYGKRFQLPELHNYGTKIANIVERAIDCVGNIFVYTEFISSGIIPLAFALEMNGFKRYRQHDRPLLNNKHKEIKYRGDYIIYTGTLSQSLYAKEYLNKGANMVNETSVKIFIGTSKASQGLNLFGYREAHILDPWHNINLIEQSIGRVIRTGSHLHLPPQERNVTVYQYAATMGNRESFDLKIYKICEKKAIKAGIIEKILKENAFDCELNKDMNIYNKEYYNHKIPLITSNNKHINISLADVEYSRSCFYMKDCNFKCSGEHGGEHGNGNGNGNGDDTISEYDLPIMRFTFDKDIEEFKNLIKKLMSTSYNIKIVNLKEYLKNYGKATTQILQTKKSKASKASKISKVTKISKISKVTNKKEELWDDEEAFNRAIQDIINNDVMITDKFGRNSKIILSGEYLRLLPIGNLEPNMSIQKQQMKIPNLYTSIDLKEYISSIDAKQKSIVEYNYNNYDHIISKLLIDKSEKLLYGSTEKDFPFNVKMTINEILDIIFMKFIYSFKLIIIKTFLEKVIKNTKLSPDELKIEPIINKHIIYMKNIFPENKLDSNPIKNIYGFIIQNENNLDAYHITPQNTFEKTLNKKKIIEYKQNIMKKTPHSQLYGFLKYEKGNAEPVFKITDTSKGEKKSIRGLTCTSKTTSESKKTLNKLDDKIIRSGIKDDSKIALCNDIEILLRRYDTISKNGKKWYYSPEEHYIMFESGV